MKNIYLVLLLMVVCSPLKAIDEFENTPYNRPFMGMNVNISVGYHKSYNNAFKQSSINDGAVFLKGGISPEFYLSQKTSPVYFYMQIPMGGVFYPKFSGYQTFMISSLFGFGAYLKEAEKGEDNFSIVMNLGVGPTFMLGYSGKSNVAIASYFALNFRHHLDSYYAIQYGVFVKYYANFVNGKIEHMVMGGISVGFAFNEFNR